MSNLRIIVERPFLADNGRWKMTSPHIPRIGDKMVYESIKYVVSDYIFSFDDSTIYLYVEECE